MAKTQKKGRCAWCGKEKVLRCSHIIPNFWGKQARRRYRKLYGVHNGRAVAVQSGFREHLLCQSCEQQFGKVEQRVARNWDRMQGQEIVLGRNGRRRPACAADWKRARRERERGKTPKVYAWWTGVDGEAWRSLAAITAFRCMASQYGKQLRQDNTWLRWLISEGLAGDGRICGKVRLIFRWATDSRKGQHPGDPVMQGVEILPSYSAEGDIVMQHGGFSLVLIRERERPLAWAETLADIGPDGRWLIMEGDWAHGKRRKIAMRLAKAIRPLAQRLRKGGKWP